MRSALRRFSLGLLSSSCLIGSSPLVVAADFTKGEGSCPVRDWREVLISSFSPRLEVLRRVSEAETKDVNPRTVPPAAVFPAEGEGVSAEDGDDAFPFVQVTEEGLREALSSRRLAVALYRDSRCTDDSPVARAFVGAAVAFKKLRSLSPSVLFAKVATTGSGSSEGKPGGVRQGGRRSCGVVFFYEQPTAFPDPTKSSLAKERLVKAAAVGDASASAALAAAVKAKPRVHAEPMAVPVQEDLDTEALMLQILKLGFPQPLKVSDPSLFRKLRFHFPRCLVRLFESDSQVSPAPAWLLAAASSVPVFDLVGPVSVWGVLKEVLPPSQVLLEKDGGRTVFPVEMDLDSQRTMTSALQRTDPLVVPLTNLTAPQVFTELRPVAFFLGGTEPAMAADWAVRAVRLRRRKSPSHRAWLAGGPCGRACLQFQEAARAWGASFAFCTSTKTSPLQSRVRAYLGLPIKRHPEVVVVTHIDSARQLTKFLCPSTESAEAIRLCFERFEKNLLAPFFKSAEPPELQKGAVYELVASRFKSVVEESARNVLLVVYSPSCPHSGLLMPAVQELAVRLANEESLLVARMDGSENEVPGVNAPRHSVDDKDGDLISSYGYPLLIFYGKSHLQAPVVYTGPRDVESMHKFVLRQAALQTHDGM